MGILTHRYTAKILLEAMTPLLVGSGDSSLLVDALVQKDHHDLPMIPGTAIAGVLRHSLEDSKKIETDMLHDVFGYGDEKGSRIIFSHALMLLNDNQVAEGHAVSIDEKTKNKLNYLPHRQHVRINNRGVAMDQGLFDNEVVYKGICFVCSIELKGTKDDTNFWETLIQTLQQPQFRVGQGTRNGYGKLKAHILDENVYNLKEKKDFDAYLNLSPSLQINANNFNSTDNDKVGIENDNYTHYNLTLEADNLISNGSNFSTFIFGEDFADEDADATTKKEEIMIYKDGKINFEEKWLIPATSIKGALSHRIAFHYNKLNEYYAQPKEGRKKGKLQTDNDAVYHLFGSEANMQLKKEDKKEERTKPRDGRRGILLMDDVYKDIGNEKIFNHVAIDRFTGGGLDGALFSEKTAVLTSDDKSIEINLYVAQNKLNDLPEKIDKAKIIKALENTLTDICKGLLPLGGMTTKGHGFFNGNLTKDGNELYPKT